ncbi:Uncharacterised protein [Mycobacteroides abscessus subsp. abscessus]|uniref:hypothetical protein n=1 Tax=Mycobacteroides abscessus TaxID=36809 RepID=UPI00092CCD7F|nr:hypothetical protein [Mycobacteroides abscessus]SHU31512.1 Uncharacterised protein [Mycobacteroides abscessus subsp. abscessus]SHX21076.1 Uncharacterised protein [Mycobacteroides abscessus subsp. abscessus]SIH54598.1 Uncharacterised protein [Mycobacteroides abscessus subsp. abscessus]SKD20033.1 Uncharacterised protein [Mycobacteroides abscessus subsp. abscessus]SKM91762.1 Uncharacterised protein [Mycobacteroides abscessus subsp. abscessus]
MSAKQVIPVAPGIFIDENPVVAIVYDLSEGASFADAVPLVINGSGGIEACKSGGEKLRTYTGSWS